MTDAPRHNDWLDVVRRKADEASHPVPDDAWKALSRALDGKAAPAKPAVSRIVWWSSAAAAAVALVAGAWALLSHDTTTGIDNGSPAVAEVATTEPATEPATDNHSSATSIIEETQGMLAENTEYAPEYSLLPWEGDELGDYAYFSEEIYEEDNDYSPVFALWDETQEWLALAAEPLVDPSTPLSDDLDPWRSYTDYSYRDYLIMDYNVRQRKDPHIVFPTADRQPSMLALSAFGSAMPSSNSSASLTSSSRQILLAPAAPGAARPHSGDVSYRHHQPLTVGVEVSKRLTPSLEAVTGLNYTMLSSTLTDQTDGSRSSQRVQLVGIPAGVKWTFWRGGHFSAYTGGEAMAERVVSAKSAGEDVTIKRLQWSLHALAGAKYNITDNISVHVEPKVSHYLNDMPLTTIRDKHAINFNLQLGVTIDLK